MRSEPTHFDASNYSCLGRMADVDINNPNLNNHIHDLIVDTAKSTSATRYFRIVLNTGAKQDWRVEVGKSQTANSTDEILVKMSSTTGPINNLKDEANKLSTILTTYQGQTSLNAEHTAKAINDS